MFDPWKKLDGIMLAALRGRVTQTTGLTVAAAGIPAPLGSVVLILRGQGDPIEGEVIGFRDTLTLISPYESSWGVRQGDEVRLIRTARCFSVGDGLLGRVVDSRGRVIDNRPQPYVPDETAFENPPPSATSRAPIDTAISTGIRCIDGLLTCGRGQRMGIFSGSGVGKSVTLGMMARYSSADVIVIALIGERGREVNEFILRDLGESGLAKSVVVVATSDQPALQRIQAAQAATSIAEYFRDQGRDVLLLMDSLTRFAMAQREVGLAAGEPPAMRGYPPSVFGRLPQLVERAGRGTHGSITAFYTVLVEGDDANEPISDTARGLLDGHIMLSRRLAGRGHYPAIDVLQSVSRLMPHVATREQQSAAIEIRQLLAAYQEHEELISISAYRQGTNHLVDRAIASRDSIHAFLQQSVDLPFSLEQAQTALIQLADACRQPEKPPNAPIHPATI